MNPGAELLMSGFYIDDIPVIREEAERNGLHLSTIVRRTGGSSEIPKIIKVNTKKLKVNIRKLKLTFSVLYKEFST